MSLVLVALTLIYFNLYTYRRDKGQYLEIIRAKEEAEAATGLKACSFPICHMTSGRR